MLLKNKKFLLLVVLLIFILLVSVSIIELKNKENLLLDAKSMNVDENLIEENLINDDYISNEINEEPPSNNDVLLPFEEKPSFDVEVSSISSVRLVTKYKCYIRKFRWIYC